MKTKLLIGLSILFAGCVLSSCSEPKPVNCRAIFEETFEVNVEAFMSTMPDVDPAKARRMGEVAMNKLYEIDSTFVLMKGKELEAFINSNRPSIEEAFKALCEKECSGECAAE